MEGCSYALLEGTASAIAWRAKENHKTPVTIAGHWARFPGLLEYEA
jgi:hypothetical protein